MSKTTQPSAAALRAVFRLFHECCELGDDFITWRRHANEGIAKLIGGFQGFNGVMPLPIDPSDIKVLVYVPHGLSDPKFERQWVQYVSAGDLRNDPITPEIIRLSNRWFSRTREQLCDTKSWYRSEYFNEFRRPMRSDDTIYSQVIISSSKVAAHIGFTRELGDRPFNDRHRRILSLFMHELGHLWRSADQTAAQDHGAGLSPRLIEVLDRLHTGDGEKQIALRIGLSRGTVHKYVTALYRRFGASSRPELTEKAIPRISFRPRLLPPDSK
jgi:DNA-binding CsgD family transcriptional regulator